MDYPKSLTKANWLASKGKFTSIADHLGIVDKSGIGGLLDNLQKAHGTIFWGAMKPGSAGTLELVEEQRKLAHEQVAKIKTVKDQANHVKSEALKFKGQWEQKRMLAKGAAMLGTIAKECENYVKALDLEVQGVDPAFDQSKTVIAKRFHDDAAKFVANLQGPLSRAEDFIGKVTANPSVQLFNTSIFTVSRDITQNIKNALKAVDIGGAVYHDEDKLRALVKLMDDWGDGKRKIKLSDASAERKEVLRELNAYRQAVDGVKHWAAANK